ncbi:MAG: polyprenyl synthetase family protein [Planctomycetaceae bacterium]|jgi:geranylgeranyl diphosphate synthase type II|nr:polyprenyl synthetase family protein [Planctomycetaceae bacterium]
MQDLSEQQVTEYLNLLKSEIDSRLDEYTQFGPDCPKTLSEPIRYSLLSRGKRIRPTMTLLACELSGGVRSKAMPAACAAEMIHTYSMIHDDLPAMDNDDLRRGQLTCHIQFDEASAILAGDALLAYAFEILARKLFPSGLAGECVAILAEASGPLQLVGGQADDMSWNAGGGTSLEFLESIHHRKTGMLILAGLRMGARIGGASETQKKMLEEYGNNYGLAFQITDDLLDWVGDEEMTGKRVHKDKSQGKLTFPTYLGLDESKKQAKERVEAACAALANFKTPHQLALQALVRLTRNLLERKK